MHFGMHRYMLDVSAVKSVCFLTATKQRLMMPIRTSNSVQITFRLWNESFSWLEKEKARRGGLSKALNLIILEKREALKLATRERKLTGARNSGLKASRSPHAT